MVDSTVEDESGATLAGEPGTLGSGTHAPGRGEFLSSGALLGRYVVIDRLGVGGMGVVYAAYDPELDRKIAVKVLHERPGSKGSIGAARLVREAQALARLSHPNVVSVHDVGTFDGRVFVAMEFVAGHTLGEWLKQAPRSGDEVLAVMAEAGRGLSAAHAAGLVHRDFKPENLMVREDGRVLVMDFGVARPTDASAEPHEVEQTAESAIRSQIDRTIDLTRTGALLGTPAYMAPEQHIGKHVDARSDQFAFCVTLYEALYRERPFGGESLMALAYQVANGKVRAPPPGAEVPSRVRRVILRGLSTDPDKRYPSMEALLAALARVSRSRARFAWAAAAAAAVIAGLAVGPVLERRQVAECTAEGERIREVWSSGGRDRVRSALATSGMDEPEQAMTRLEPWLNRYADELSRQRQNTCLDRKLHATRSNALNDAADDCLDERSDALAVLIDELASGDRDLAIRAVQAAAALPATGACEQDRVLFARVVVSDDTIRAGVREARRNLLRAHTLSEAGRYEESERVIREVAGGAGPWDHAPLAAESALALGDAQARQAHYEDAVSSLEQAFTRALGAGHDEVATTAAIALVDAFGVKLAKADDARRWESIARSLLHRIAAEEGLLAARLDLAGGTVHLIKGDYDAAGAGFARALSTYDSLLGPEHPSVASALNMLGILSLVRGDYDQALTYHQRALGIRESVLGPRHPTVAQSLANIGNVHYSKEDYAKAVESYRLSLEISEHVFGADHPNVATDLNNLGNAYDLLGDQEAALKAYDRSLAIRERVFGPEHPMVAQTLHNISIVERALGRYEPALMRIERALEIKAASVGEDHDSYGRSLLEYGRLRLEMGQPETARKQLERAVEIAEKSQGDLFALADARYTLARALADLDAHSARARELAEQARDGLAEGEHEQLRAEIDELRARLTAN